MVQKEYHGFLYQYDIDGYHIVPKDEVQRPSSFYKYYALTEYNVEALTNMYLYATHPNQLNDPLDCAEELIKYDDNNVIRSFWDSLYPSLLPLCNGNEEAIYELSRKAYHTFLYMKLGIFSLSINCLDIPMWSAYTNHEGFCIELDFSDLPYKTIGPYPVNYLDNLESISLKEESIQLATIIQTNIKNSCWKHEEEWRLLLECPAVFFMEPFGYFAAELKKEFPDYHNRKFKYPMRCLKSVCLGKSFFNGICSVITDAEKEYVATNKLKNDVLSFLALSRISTFVLDTNELEVMRVPIEITQIRNDAYHINV
ncbi:MAG: DUF2971 domain-containing protein [Prevotella sp.]|nr:DUF2971 domain-containing protein [Prevotella sp.]